jgi:ribosome-binding factor A
MTRRTKRSRESAGSVLDPRGSQVVSSAQRTLALAIDDARDPVLSRSRLLSVAPHPDASCLRLVVSAKAADVALVRDALARARSYLRAELAADLDRRRTPELVFMVVAEDDA